MLFVNSCNINLYVEKVCITLIALVHKHHTIDNIAFQRLGGEKALAAGFKEITYEIIEFKDNA